MLFSFRYILLRFCYFEKNSKLRENSEVVSSHTNLCFKGFMRPYSLDHSISLSVLSSESKEVLFL